MGKFRYIRDYAILEDAGEDGKLKTSAQYIAAGYVFDQPQMQLKKTRAVLTAAAVILWAAFLGGMVPLSAAMKTLYAALPYAFCGLWIALYTRSVLALYPASTTLTRKKADLLNSQFPAACMLACIFSLLALLGEGICLAAGGECLAGDYVWIACGAALFTVSAAAFRQRGKVRLHSMEEK